MADTSSVDVPSRSTVVELLGHYQDGSGPASTARIKRDDLASQLLGSGPIASAISEAKTTAAAGAISPRDTVAAGQTAALPANTYANGSAGVGATITANANGALVASYFDTVTLVVGMRLWVGLEGLKNGIYTLTQIGTASLPWIMTRATDSDTPAELGLHLFYVNSGTTYGGKRYQAQQVAANITIGTTMLTYVLASDQTTLNSEVTAGRGGRASLDARASMIDRKGLNIAAAATTDLGAATAGFVEISGTGASITALGSATAGEIRVARFQDVNTIVHNATSLFIPGGLNFVTAAGDMLAFRSLGGGNWVLEFVTSADVIAGRGGKANLNTRASLLDRKGADIAAAATTDLGAATGGFVDVTGSGVTITALGTALAGEMRVARFAGANTLTHNATSMILPGGVNLPIAAGDILAFRSLGSGNWICVGYTPAAGTASAATLVALVNEVSGARFGAVDLPTAVDPAVKGLKTETIGKSALGAGTTSWNSFNYVHQTAATVAGVFRKANINVPVDQDVLFGVYTLNGDGTLTCTGSMHAWVKAGGVMGIPVNLPIAPGQFVGFKCASNAQAVRYTTGGAPLWYGAGGVEITTNTGKTSTSAVTAEFGAVIVGTLEARLGQDDDLRSDLGDRFSSQVIGKNPVALTGSAWNNSYIIIPSPARFSGFVPAINIALAAAQSVAVGVFTRNGDGTFTRTAVTGVSAPAGANQDVALPSALPIAAGQFIGFRCATGVQWTSGTGAPVWFSGTEIVSNQGVSTSSAVTLEFSVKVVGEGLAKLAGISASGQSGSASWAGKKMRLIGSSITADRSYSDPLCAKLGTIQSNGGYAGGSIAQSTNGHPGSQKIYDQIALSPTDTDIFAIECGPNDFSSCNVPLGTFGDETLATYYGALWSCIPACQARAPAADIIFMGGHSGAAAHATHRIKINKVISGVTVSFEMYQEAQARMARYMGFHFTDFGRQGGINYFTAQDWTTDYLHLSPAGGGKMADFIYEDWQPMIRAGY